MDLQTARSMSQRRRRSAVNAGDYYPLDGGLNLVDTPLKVKPGELLSCQNYDLGVRGGYRRVRGFERIDGRPKASTAQYYLLRYTGGITANFPAVGSTIATGTGSAVLLKALTAAEGTMVLGRITGTFAAAQAVQFSATTFATASGAATTVAATIADDLAYRVLAREDLRSQIQALPGAGRVLGVVIYNGVVYAFRNATNNLTAAMWKSSATGWTAVALGVKVKFTAGGTGGTTEILPGQVITGQTSGATGTVRRVVVTSGTWGAANAAGYLIFSSVATGPFTGTENLRIGGVTRAVFASQSSQTLAPNGRYEFRIHNFYGNASTQRLYGVDGQNYAFEFQDGATPFFLQIETGMVVDRPAHLEVCMGRLFLTYQGGSLQYSGTSDPAVITVNTGAGEIAVGDEITGLMSRIGNVLFIFSRNRTDTLSGTGPENWTLAPFSDGVGAVEWSIQDLAGGVFLDAGGFTTLAASQRFGNFQSNTVSSKVEPLARALKTLATASIVIPSLNTYRLFLSDGRFVTIGSSDAKITGFMQGSYGKTIRCTFAGEATDGSEFIVLGGEDGFVYQAESGTSFDGQAIGAFLQLAFHHNRSPSQVKRYRHAKFDVRPGETSSFICSPTYSYGRSDVQSDPAQELIMVAAGGTWDVTLWDDYASLTGISDGSMKLEGSGENIGFILAHLSAVEEVHSIEGVILHESLRRVQRGT